MCANQQTADDAILYKHVVPRTITNCARPGKTSLALKSQGKPEASSEQYRDL